MKGNKCCVNNIIPYKEKSRIILCLVTILFITILGTFSYLINNNSINSRNTNKKEIENLISEVISQNDLHQLNSVKEGNNNVNDYYIFYSNTENEDLINQLKQQTHKKSKHLENVSSVVVSYISEESSEEYIFRSIMTNEYHWREEERYFFLQNQEKLVVDILFSSSRRNVRISDLVKDEANLLTIDRVVKEKILEKHNTPKKIIKNVLELPSLTFESDLAILPSSLNVRANKEIFGFGVHGHSHQAKKMDTATP